jgi:hypothetical protein
VEKFFRRRQCIELPHRLVAVHRQIAKVFNNFNLGKHRRPDSPPKSWLVNQRAQMILIGKS